MITKFKLFENKSNILPIGTTVRVLPKLEEFIKKHHLDKNWNRIIGKILKIEDFFLNHSECKEDVYVLNSVDKPTNQNGIVTNGRSLFGFIVPIDCVEKADINKISSEHDPYGEEDWNDDVYTFEQFVDRSTMDPYNEEIWDEEDEGGDEGGEEEDPNIGEVRHMITMIAQDFHRAQARKIYIVNGREKNNLPMIRRNNDHYVERYSYSTNEHKITVDKDFGPMRKWFFAITLDGQNVDYPRNETVEFFEFMKIHF